MMSILRKKAPLGAFVRLFERWVSPIVPQVLAFTAFIGGAILLFSDTLPAVEQRIVFLAVMLVPGVSGGIRAEETTDRGRKVH